MQIQNQFLDFAEQVIARHKGFGSAFDPAFMIYLEDMEPPQEEEARPAQNIVTNLYHIQNIKEENYLFQQNLTFLSQILEKRLYQKLYPSVEKQIEKAVREEMPQAEEKIVKSFSQQLVKLVERGGIEQFEIIRDRILSEYREKEHTISKEQEVLFRKIENIYNSSVYQTNAQHTNQTLQTDQRLVQQNAVQVDANRYSVHQVQQEYPLMHTEHREQTILPQHRENILEYSTILIKEQEQLVVPQKKSGTGNLGLYYQVDVTEVHTPPPFLESHVEDIRQIRTETEHVIDRRLAEVRKDIVQHQDIANLTYLEEENTVNVSNERPTEEIHREIQKENELQRYLEIHNELLTETVRQELQNREDSLLDREQTVEEGTFVQPTTRLLESRVEDIRQIRTETEHVTDRQSLEVRKDIVQHQDIANLTYLEEENIVNVSQELPTEEIHREIRKENDLQRQMEIQKREDSFHDHEQPAEERSFVQPTTRLLESHVEDIRQVRTEKEHVTDRLPIEVRTDIVHHQDTAKLNYLEEETKINVSRNLPTEENYREIREETQSKLELPKEVLAETVRQEKSIVRLQEIVETKSSSEKLIQETILEGQAHILHQISNQMIAPRTIKPVTQNMSLVTQLGNTDIQASMQDVSVQNLIQNLRKAENRNWTDVQIRQDSMHLEYTTEETENLHEEIMQIVQSEVNRAPEIPKVVVEKEMAERQQIIRERSRHMAEQILERVDQAILSPVHTNITQVSSVAMQTARPIALQHLSQMILEYADSNITVEDLSRNMTQVLEQYQENRFEQVYEELNSVPGVSLEKNSMGTVIIRNSVKQPESAQALEPAVTVYRSEEDSSSRQEEKTSQLERQVNEIVKNIRTVEEKTIVHKEELLEQQKIVVRDVLKSSPVVWSEGEGASYIRREVQQSIEEQVNEHVNQIVNKVYRRLEDRLKTERGRRGLI